MRRRFDKLRQGRDRHSTGKGRLRRAVRGDLAEALGELARKSNERSFRFDRVLIETTGIADPGPIIQTFLAETTFRFGTSGHQTALTLNRSQSLSTCRALSFPALSLTSPLRSKIA